MTDAAGAAKIFDDETAALRAELERLISRVRAAATDAGFAGDDLVARGRAAAEAADTYVHRAPVASAAIAFLAGCLVGRLLR
jgi:ElaB/YqjD/DUF883 family membrane-anchored ribosome-binding protein